jgi:predicted chitinase
MSLNREQIVFLQHVAELIRKAPDYGLLVTAGELYRTSEQQALHVQYGRSKTMNSQHLKRLAVDLNFFQQLPDGSLQLTYDGDNVRLLGAFWESLDPAANRWGGNWSSFKDTPHFERRENSRTAEAGGPHPASSISSSGARPPAPAAGSFCGAKLLAGTVGVRCQNQPYDVESIQRLLNLHRDRIGLADPLSCDGKFGQHTLTALSDFQQTVLAQPEPSGTVSPGDSTLLALCAALPKSLDPILMAFVYLNASEPDIRSLTPFLLETMAKYDINTPVRQAHFLAQVGHESGELLYKKELASGTAYENRRDLGNTQPGDGPHYKGRGLIQLTGRANYADYSRTGSLKVDVEADPEQVATNEQLCVDVAGWFWDRRGLNTFADRDDLETVTRRVNGGLNGLDNRRRLLSRAKTLLGA